MHPSVSQTSKALLNLSGTTSKKTSGRGGSSSIDGTLSCTNCNVNTDTTKPKIPIWNYFYLTNRFSNCKIILLEISKNLRFEHSTTIFDKWFTVTESS